MAKKKNKVFYLTFSYYPSGVFKSQIFDVIRLMRELSGKEVRLISFFSVRVYFKCRKWVKAEMPDAIVLPILFGMKRWMKHSSMLKRYVGKEDFIIGRNPMGARIGLGYTDKVIFDGRSALRGEVSEYGMSLNKELDRSFIEAEEYAVKNSHFRMAVSSKLVDWWKKDLDYNSDQHLIVPCSLAYSHSRPLIEREKNAQVKFVFSGGGSPWQSQEEKYNWIRSILEKREDTAFIFLSKSDPHMEELMKDYPNRVERKWVTPEQVYDELCGADYGILLRENNLTNRVAAPVKFAEYLNAGLKVIISDCVGDYADFVSQHDCGIVLNKLHSDFHFDPLEKSERKTNRALAEEWFSKEREYIRGLYQQVMEVTDRS